LLYVSSSIIVRGWYNRPGLSNSGLGSTPPQGKPLNLFKKISIHLGPHESHDKLLGVRNVALSPRETGEGEVEIGNRSSLCCAWAADGHCRRNIRREVEREGDKGDRN
jgi:hypothetical protein